MTHKTCPICIDDITNDLYRTGCQHLFHRKCIMDYVKYNENHSLPIICPLCGVKFELIVKTNTLYSRCFACLPQLIFILVVISLAVLGTLLVHFLI